MVLVTKKKKIDSLTEKLRPSLPTPIELRVRYDVKSYIVSQGLAQTSLVAKSLQGMSPKQKEWKVKNCF